MSVNKNKKPKLSETGQVKYFLDAADSMSPCQIYREVAKNSIEANARMKKIDPSHEGFIIVEEDSTFPNKFTITDNGIGMCRHNMSDLIINLSETEEQSEEGNFGMGSKAAGFANNKEGMIYTSKRYNENDGSRCKIAFDANDRFTVEYSDEYNSCTLPLELSELPRLIQKYKRGTSLTLVGNSREENTWLPPENYEEGSLLKRARKGIYWLKAYYNTKFFTIPDYIKFMVQIFREGRTNLERVYGHKHWLDHFSKASGTLEHETAKIHWWLLSDEKGKRNSANDCVPNGQLGIINNNEMIEIALDGTGQKNPLRYWGLPFSCADVAVIIEPIGFKQNQFRTSLRKDRVNLQHFKTIWKDFFMVNTPQEILSHEAEQAQKNSEKMNNDALYAKKMNKWLQDMHFLHASGTISAQQLPLKGYLSTTKGDLMGEFNGGGNSVEPGKKLRSNVGKSLLYAGLKDVKEKHSASKGQVNTLPEVIIDKSQSDDSEWVWYAPEKNTIYLNNKCRMINIWAKAAHKENKHHIFETHRQNTLNILGKRLQRHVMMTQFAPSNLSEENKQDILKSDKFFSTLIMDPLLVDQIVEMSKNLKQQMAEFDKHASSVNGKGEHAEH